MISTDAADIRQICHPYHVSDELRSELIACWRTVNSNADKNAFPQVPVADDLIPASIDQIIRGLSPQCSQLSIALVGHRVVGWAHLSRSLDPLKEHWGTVRHLQTHPSSRGRGVGSTLADKVRAMARDAMGLEQLHISVWSGTKMTAFYTHRGWVEVSRCPGAVRMAPGDDRDEVVMVLSLL